jgi:UDP-glucose 4-epimerase
MKTVNKTALVTGAAGFVGSFLVERLLAENYSVIGLDNLIRGKMSHLEHAKKNPRFSFIEVDISDDVQLKRQMHPILQQQMVDVVWHLAANSDIGAGVADPSLDLRDTFMTTFNILKLMEAYRIQKIAFSSTSAIYGEKENAISEDAGPLFPISNYGAMKLASEALISAYLEKCLTQAWIFRFPNVVGPRATHGVIYDLFHKLKRSSARLEVLGDGSQCKPYLHVSDLIEAMWYIVQHDSQKLAYYNVGQVGEGTSVNYIAEALVRRSATHAKIEYTGGKKGWVGDINQFHYDVSKLQSLGWKPSVNSKQSVDRAIDEIAQEFGF